MHNVDAVLVSLWLQYLFQSFFSLLYKCCLCLFLLMVFGSLSKQVLHIMVLYSWWHLLLLSSFPSQYSWLFIWCDITYAHGTALLNETSNGLAEMCFPVTSIQKMIWPAIYICKLTTSECVTWNRDVQNDMFYLHLTCRMFHSETDKLCQHVGEVILSKKSPTNHGSIRLCYRDMDRNDCFL
jgi:hypothetical protein